MQNLTIAMVNFNTPEYLMPFCKSLVKSNSWAFADNLIVYDNGDKRRFPSGDNGYFTCIHVDADFYKEFENMKMPNDPGCRHFCSAKHCKTLQHIIDNTHTKYLLICDSDIIFTKNFKALFDEFVNGNYAACAFIRKPYRKVDRLAPWFTLINVDMIKENGINYYDEKRMIYVNGNTSHDTGAVLLEDCIKKNLKILEIPSDNLYYYHYKGGSYLNMNRAKMWLMQHKEYWM